MKRDELLLAIKNHLQAAFGERLKGVVLHGSEARGESDPESDIDILVLLQGPVDYGEELERVIDAVFPIELASLRPIHAIPVDEKVFEAQQYTLYINAKSEGTRL